MPSVSARIQFDDKEESRGSWTQVEGCPTNIKLIGSTNTVEVENVDLLLPFSAEHFLRIFLNLHLKIGGRKKLIGRDVYI